MNFLNFVYRWCNSYGGGLVIAASIEEARAKVMELHNEEENDELVVWPWKNDDYFNEEHPDVLDIYGL